MTYWRMQLHPDSAGGAVKHTVESLSAGYIGLDFASDVGDMQTITREQIPEGQRNYWAFAHEMAVGNRVLLFTHHFPFALVRVSGAYNFIRAAVPELGVWFRHFRAVDEVRYYGDCRTNAREWRPLTMTATITPLREPDSESYKLIESWLRAAL